MDPDTDTDDIRRRLTEVESEIVRLAGALMSTGGPETAMRGRLDQLRTERDALRGRLGLPPLDPPSRQASPVGWIVLVGAVVAIVAVLWLISTH